MERRLHEVEVIKDVNVYRDDEGNPVTQKGTRCVRVKDGTQELVSKKWVAGDWVFPGEYEYGVEKQIYLATNSMGLPVPNLVEYDDDERHLLIEYIAGERVEWPCDRRELLRQVLHFFDAYKDITFHSPIELFPMEGELVHKYRLDQLQFSFPEEEIWSQIDDLYESFLEDVPHYTLPFDRILKNTLLLDDVLKFIDFEWTISGPHEFTLARVAVEFRALDHPEIHRRVQSRDMYLFFLFRFYMYAQEAPLVFNYLWKEVSDPRLVELLQIVTREQYGDETWSEV